MSTKPTNPKDAIGSNKLPLELVPDVIPAYAALAFLEGATKYGRFNWRIAGVRSSIYIAAARRHLSKYWNGEDCDPETGVPHLASVLACVGIILDAQTSGSLTDDRPPYQDIGSTIAALEARVNVLKLLHADKTPKQFTIADGTMPPLTFQGVRIKWDEAEKVEVKAPSTAMERVLASVTHLDPVVEGPTYDRKIVRAPEDQLHVDMPGPLPVELHEIEHVETVVPTPRGPACRWCQVEEGLVHAVGCPGSVSD